MADSSTTRVVPPHWSYRFYYRNRRQGDSSRARFISLTYLPTASVEISNRESTALSSQLRLSCAFSRGITTRLGTKKDWSSIKIRARVFRALARFSALYFPAVHRASREWRLDSSLRDEPAYRL